LANWPLVVAQPTLVAVFSVAAVPKAVALAPVVTVQPAGRPLPRVSNVWL
jgi:hypothetical protein